VRIEAINIMTVMNISIADIGRVKKIRKLPPEIKSDWRRFTSTIGPRTRARHNGAGSYSNFLRM
jgi:hypothetical protein